MPERFKEIINSAISSGPAVSADTRLTGILQIEWTLLAARYICLILLVGYYAIGHLPPFLPNLWSISILVLAHNAFIHWILMTNRLHFFVSFWNFLVYLVEISMVVYLSGGEESPIALLYLLLIFGYCVYTPRVFVIVQVTLFCCAAYAVTILLHWMVVGSLTTYSPIGFHLLALMGGGWLAASMGNLLVRMKQETHQQALTLASSESTLRGILNSVIHPVVVYDENEFINDGNDRACQYFEVTLEELCRRRFRSFLFDDGTLPNKLATLLGRGEYHGECIVVPEEGDERNAELVIRSFMNGKNRYFVAMLLDITEEKAAEEARRHAQLKVEEVNRRLQQIDGLRLNLFSTISQRLRSPMSAILGMLELLLNEDLGETTDEQRRALQTCRQSALQIFKLVDESVDAMQPAESTESILETTKRP